MFYRTKILFSDHFGSKIIKSQNKFKLILEISIKKQQISIIYKKTRENDKKIKFPH